MIQNFEFKILKWSANFLENLQYKERHTPLQSRINFIVLFLTKKTLEFWLSIDENLKEEYEYAMDCMIHKYNKEGHIIFSEIKSIIGITAKEAFKTLKKVN